LRMLPDGRFSDIYAQPIKKPAIAGLQFTVDA